MGYPSLDELKTSVLGPAPKIRDVIADAPRLAHVVEDLESDRRDLLNSFSLLPVDEAVHRLRAFRQKAADLLYQAYEVDLGGET